MKVLWLIALIGGLAVLISANKRCDKLVKTFEECLEKGFTPRKLKGCKVGDGKLEKTDKKKCAKLEKVVTKKCDYSCQSDGDDEDKEDKKEQFVPDPNARYTLKKVGGPGNGLSTSIQSNSKRNSVSWFVSLANDRPIPWQITPAKCDCDGACKCYKFGFRARVSCCQSWDFALAVHSDQRANGDGRAITHKTPHKEEDESWIVEAAEGGYKLKKAQGRHVGKYLVAGEKRDGSTFWADVTDDASAASLWDIVKN
ncbi:hypothetical protein ACHWQZ_G000241 [Mnemiopsis leidyi]